jgi:hypothetical protein
LKETIEKNGINLNFHKFKSQNQKKEIEKEGDQMETEEEIFTYLNGREKDLKKSGISNLYNLLATEYDHVDHAVSTNLKHRVVFEEIERISKRKSIIPSQNEKKEKKSLFGKLKSSFTFGDLKEMINNPQNKRKTSLEIIEVLKVEEPFVEVSDLIKILNEKNDLNEKFKRDELESILEDLHKLGLIIYFKKKTLSNTIISNPQWFNLVNKNKNFGLFFFWFYYF